MTATAIRIPARLSGRTGLFALGLGAFVVGTAELLVVGVLNLVARELKVSVASAGMLVTGYALAIAFGGPLLTAATIRLDRRRVLWFALAVYVAGTRWLVAGSLPLLVIARVSTGSMHGLLWASRSPSPPAWHQTPHAGRASCVTSSRTCPGIAMHRRRGRCRSP